MVRTIGICSLFLVLMTLTNGQILTTTITSALSSTTGSSSRTTTQIPTTNSDVNTTPYTTTTRTTTRTTTGTTTGTTTTFTKTTKTTRTIEYGPINMVVDQLAGLSVDVSDQTSSQLRANIDQALAVVTGNIESLSTNALAEVEGAIIEANQLVLDNPSCNPAWNLQQFTANVTSQLDGCTFNLNRLLEAFREDGAQVMSTVQSFVQQMAQLPMVCQQGQLAAMALGPFGVDFDNSNNCFLNGITAINQGLAKAMHNASLFLVHTRRLSQEQVKQSEQCTAAVVSQVLKQLEAQRANCS